ncbi:MAG TPA: FtsX-like permease family protein [Thermoanaerobaculia bacterium]|nr:FtsX-like permease family protein [Thermoanaerobaculia bacterium]
MIAPRWRKVLRDIAEAPGRATLSVVAMAAGVFGIAMILTSYAIMTRELARSYAETRPASATLHVHDLNDELLASVRRFPGVLDAESRPVIFARMRVGEDEWVPLVLYVVPDFNDLRMDRFTRSSGAWPPGDGEILVEQSSLPVARAAAGDSVTMRTPGGIERSLRISGIVHAPGLAPGWMEHSVTGYAGLRSIARADAQAETSRLSVIVAGNQLDETHIREVVGRLKNSLESQGHKVAFVDVPPPGRHPHADQMDTFLFLLGAFGALTLVLSAVLVANMIHALLTEQIRQVGIMKAIGATTNQIAALYLGQVSILATAALCIGMPLGYAAGRGYARFAAGILNTTIVNAAEPLWAIAIQIAVGLGLPLFMSLGPVAAVSRITIREALNNDAGHRPFGSRAFDRWLARIAWVPRPLMLSLRTTLQRRGRLLLTIGTLAAGGAVFISALNVAAAWTRVIDQDYRSRPYDVDVRFAEPYQVARIANIVAGVPDIARAEYWPEVNADIVGASGAADIRGRLVGPEASTPLLRLRMLEGRWLASGDEDVVVINQNVQASVPWLHAGGPIGLRIGGKELTWRVAGIAKELGHGAGQMYAPPRSILRAAGQTGDATRTVRVVTRQHDIASQTATARAIERALQRDGIKASLIQSLADRRKSFEDHLVIIKSALVFAATLVVIVGCLGLTITLTINVIERTREIGILSAIGATPRTISRYVVFEGVLMGFLSWWLAIIGAIPSTYVMNDMAGRMFTKSSLGFLMSPLAIVIWLVLVVALASLSSFVPARRSSRMAAREALAYE